MLDNHGFDLWANTYDDSVTKSEESDQYPFAGYSKLMNAIYGTVMERAPAKVLDIGFGTAFLTSRLYDGGNAVTGIDFSSEMIRIASQKMPGAQLLPWNFTQGLPDTLTGRTFDFIISTYALHHLTDGAKPSFLTGLLDLLEPDGAILIGDVCFPTRAELLSCKAAHPAQWDEDEIYFVLSELIGHLGTECRVDYHPFSHCSGVIEIRRS